MFKSYGLFAMPSFFKGMGMALDLGNTFLDYDYSDSPTEADINALRSDWSIIGNDISSAIHHYEKKHV